MATTLKPSYITAVSLTVTSLNSLATDTNLLAGWQSDSRDNTSDLWGDVWLSGKLTAGTSPTASKTIEIWVAGVLDGGTTWPDAITGSQGTCSLTSTNVKNAGLRPVHVITNDATSARVYPFGPFSIGALFGGALPPKYAFYIVHNTGVSLASSGNSLWLEPMQWQGV
jgi:hypothetical protein